MSSWKAEQQVESCLTGISLTSGLTGMVVSGWFSTPSLSVVFLTILTVLTQLRGSVLKVPTHLSGSNLMHSDLGDNWFLLINETLSLLNLKFITIRLC